MRNLPRSNRRLFFLLGGLLIAVIALPIARRYLTGKPAPLPVAASVEDQRRYWLKRIKTDVSDKEAYVRLGQLEEKAGYYMSAVKYLRAARTLGVGDEEICAPLGRALHQIVQDTDAVPELQKAYRLAPDSVDAVVNLAGVAATSEQPEEARKLLKSFAATHSNLKVEELRRLMFCFLECDDDKEAGNIANSILSTIPDDLIARGVAARSALSQNDYPTAKQQLEAILKQQPEDAGALYLYGNVLDALGDPANALLHWQKAVAVNPKAPDPFERIGEAYEKKSDFIRAAAAYENLAKLSPTDVTARHAARALTQAGQKEKAAYWIAVAAGYAGDFKMAVQEGMVAAASSDPITHRQGLGAVAEAYRGMKQREPYMATMRQMTAGGSVEDLLLLAQAYGEVDDHKKRTECLLEALKKAPPERRSAIQYDMAVIYRTRGMMDEAESSIDAAVAADPKNPALYRLQAEIHYSRLSMPGQLEKAIAAWETAVSLDPQESSDWQHLGVAYLAENQPVKAVEYLEHAVDMEPGSGPAYQELSKAYKKLGDTSTAQQMMSLYTKYVAFDQQRQTLRTRARRPHATATDLVAYGDLVVKMSDYSEAVPQYEKALLLTPNDQITKEKLAALYRRLRMADRLIVLEAGQKKTVTGVAR